MAQRPKGNGNESREGGGWGQRSALAVTGGRGTSQRPREQCSNTKTETRETVEEVYVHICLSYHFLNSQPLHSFRVIHIYI